MIIKHANFKIGQLISHKLFHYRGVIADVDPVYAGSEEWYAQMALSRPPKNAPWYRVLVHNALHETYVAERNLETDSSSQPVNHPLVDSLFERFENGIYIPHQRKN